MGVRVCVTRDENVHIHLSGYRAQRVKVAGGYTLMSMDNTNPDWRMSYGY